MKFQAFAVGFSKDFFEIPNSIPKEDRKKSVEFLVFFKTFAREVNKMSIRDYLEQKIQNYNGNNRVIGTLGDGTKIELIFELEGQLEDEIMDLSTGMRYSKEEFVSFANTSDYFDLKIRTKNHQARNQYAYKDSGKNHKREKGNLSHLIK